MSSKRRSFQRHLGQRSHRRLFLIAVEGAKTEHPYFALFNDTNSIIRVECLKGGHASSPESGLRRMENYLEREALKASDEAWIVVDKDQWMENQLDPLHLWSIKHDNYGFALSNPKFEYWLLLHFEDGANITSPRDCTHRLKHHLPSYDKGIDMRQFTRERIDNAMRRARQRDNPPCIDWPRGPGVTTVYWLIEHIINV